MNNKAKIAYFSMEIGLSNNMPTYSGGLGILAGDTIKSSADLKIPLVAVTLISKEGFFRQDIDREGRQIEYTANWEPSKYLMHLPKKVDVQIEGRKVSIHAWSYKVRSVTGGEVEIIFLDTYNKKNTTKDRENTTHLYYVDN